MELRRTRPEQPAKEYVREYLEEHEDPDLDFFTWEIATAYGLTETEAGELIRRIQTELHRDSADTWEILTRCPLCKRHGIDTRLIMNPARAGELRRLSR